MKIFEAINNANKRAVEATLSDDIRDDIRNYARIALEFNPHYTDEIIRVMITVFEDGTMVPSDWTINGVEDMVLNEAKRLYGKPDMEKRAYVVIATYGNFEEIDVENVGFLN